MKRTVLYALVIVALHFALFAPISVGNGQWETFDPEGGDCTGSPHHCYHYTPSSGGTDHLEPVNDNTP